MSGLVLFLSVALAADADADVTGIAGSPIYSTGDIRYVAALPPDFVANTDGVSVGQSFVLHQRLRPGFELRLDQFEAHFEADVLTGQLVGDPWDIPRFQDARQRQDIGVLDDGDAFVPRRGSISGRLGPVGVEAGLVTSHWGLGMVANDGAHDPVGFGVSEFGDRVLRLRVGTALLGEPGEAGPLRVGVAGDRVVEDDTARLDFGQAAWQGIGSVVWVGEDGARYGLYGVYRNQTEADLVRKTEAGVLDLFVSQPLSVGDNSLTLALEAAGIRGSTSRSTSYNSREGLAIRSAGLAAQARFALPDDVIAATLRGGWASGDGNPDDDTSHDFAFDRDFDVGMVMFDELGGAVEAAAYSQLTDPQYSAVPAEGIDAIVSEGAFRRAAFVQPIVELKPKPWLSLKTGAVLAWQTAPIAQPFETYQNGGNPTNHLGEATTGYALGTEVDWAIGLGDTPTEIAGLTTRPQLLVQGGHLFASDDFGGSTTGTLSSVLASARVRW